MNLGYNILKRTCRLNEFGSHRFHIFTDMISHITIKTTQHFGTDHQLQLSLKEGSEYRHIKTECL